MNFDPQDYLDIPIDKPLERRQPVPAGDYIATVKNVEARTWQSKDKYDERTGMLKSGLVFDVTFTVELPESVQTICGINQLTVKDGIMIDRTESGAIDDSPGRNGRLRQYREALGMNQPGEPFKARAMIGRMLRIRITHEEYQGNIMEKVGALAKVG